MDRKELAIKLHRKGYNCAQCVACVFADKTDIDEETIFKMAEAFGGGMGTASTCGAVSGMAMVIGMEGSDGNLDSPRTKGANYRLMSQATSEFKAKNQSTICREIKGMDTGHVLRSCDGCIEDAVEILEKLTEK